MSEGDESRTVLGYTTADIAELKGRLQRRRVPEEEIDRALSHLSGPDPAGVLPTVTRDDVARAAVHMNMVIPGVEYAYPSPWWQALISGHPAARAIFYHEQEEMAALAALGVEDPDVILRTSMEFEYAHALACFREAEYWEKWAAAEGEAIPASAFLVGNPARRPKEVALIQQHLWQVWQIEVSRTGRVDLDRARAFYAQKGMV